MLAGNSVTVTAESGTNGGAAGSNTIAHAGGAGGSGASGSAHEGGGGGGGAGGDTGAGVAVGPGGVSGGNAGAGNDGGGDGGAGGGAEGTASPGTAPGGGGGGGGKTDESGHAGAAGAAGQITVTYSGAQAGTADLTGAGTLAAAGYIQLAAGLAGAGQITAGRSGFAYAPLTGTGTLTASPIVRAPAALSGAGAITASGGGPAPAVVNQWANSYGQGTTFTGITSALQSCVVPLTPASSTGPGSGVPSPGNWLFCIASWTQDPQIINVHTGVSDDIHSWWRQFPAAGSGGYTRTSISYTPNIARSAGNVYVAPDMEIAAINVIVAEVSGLGPWDAVEGTVTAYDAASETISLSVTPSAPAFFIGAVGGDNASATVTFAPAGWTPLAAQSQSNGVNTLADNILAAAFLPSSSSAQDVSGSATIAENLSGFLLAVAVVGASPVPAGWNPDWPYTRFECAFGAGFSTPASELTWTDLTSRLWHWDETTGVQYQLGTLQATNLDIELDNYDGLLSPDNSQSPYAGNLTAGTPIRIRAALGAYGGVTYNRWYVIERNAGQWGEEITEEYRRFCPVTGTDLWAALSATPPTFYRSEIYEDAPYAWWPMDDQPGTSGVQPTVLRNAAEGNSSVLDILLSPNGASVQLYYTESGATTQAIPPGLASYQAGANQGWMFGDPTSGAPSLATGNSVTAEPGSASWTVQGQGGDTGGYGWYLACTDSGFPAISGGITVEIWFNYAYYGTANGVVTSASDVGEGNVTISPATGQPYATPFTIWALGTTSATTAELQLDASGHLNLVLSGTSHSVYSGSDLRSSSWHMATVTITSTAWAAWLDGGANAQVSGTGSPSSSWSVLTVGAAPGGLGGCGNASFSHAAVYPYVLPYYRVLDHYWAAVTAFGQLPAPTGTKVTWTGIPQVAAAGTYVGTSEQVFNPDGTPPYVFSPENNDDGGQGEKSPAGASLVAVAAAAGVTSGPSPVATGTDAGFFIVEDAVQLQYFIPWYSWQGLSPLTYVYTSAGGSGQTLYAIVNGSGTGPSAVSDYGGEAPDTPPAASLIGDTVGQRMERLLRAGRCASPQRSIDPAPLLVQAPGTQGGGIQVGTAIQAIQQSDSGWMFIDNMGNLCYWQRPHLASQFTAPAWALGFTAPGSIPYYPDVKWVTDPQYVWNTIDISPFSPTGAQLPLITPQDAAAADASQIRYGAQPYQVQSMLQDQSQMQLQADWLLATYGQPVRHAERVVVEASAYPPAWGLFWGINVGDVVTMEDWQIGGGGAVGTFRVSSIKRRIIYGSHTEEVTARAELILSYEPASYWGVQETTQGTAALAGAGTVTAAPEGTQHGTASLAGTGAVSATATGTGSLISSDSKTPALYVLSSDTGALLTNLAAAESATGVTFTALEVFNTNVATWDDWTDPWFCNDPSQDYISWVAANPSGRQLIVSMNLISEAGGSMSDPLTWETNGAAGDFNSYATTLAENLVAAGFGYSVIRLGLECNGNWNIDSIGGSTPGGGTSEEQAAWVSTFQQEVTAMRAVEGAHFLFCWCPNAVVAGVPFADYYPGSDYVDIIGIDAYDAFASGSQPSPSAGTTADLFAQSYGINDITTFASAQGKPLALGEWGCQLGGPDGGLGDDPYYVEGIAAWIAANSFAFHSYFDSGTDSIIPLSSDYPLTLAAYSAAFGGGTPTFTVSAAVTSFNSGGALKVFAVTGVTETGGASAALQAYDPSAATVSLTPEVTGSLVLWGVFERNTTALSAAASNSISDTAEIASLYYYADGQYTGTVTGGTPVTAGCSTSVNDWNDIVAYELAKSGTPAIDASTPAAVTGTSSPLATMSFTPPAGAVLCAVVLCSTTASSTITITDTSGLGLTWTQRAIVTQSGSYAGVAAIYTATLPG